MLDYLNWYLVELKLALNGLINPDRLDTILKETSGHLTESAEIIEREQQVGKAQAVMLAIQQFGKPEKVARTYLQEASPIFLGTKPIRWVLLAAVVATFFWNFEFEIMNGYFDNFGDSWQLVAGGLTGIISLAVLFAACRSGYRLYRVSLVKLVFAMSFASIFLLSFWIVGSNGYQGISRFHFGRDVAKVKATVSKLSALEAYVVKGRKLFAAAKSIDDIPFEYRNIDSVAKLTQLDTMHYFSPLRSADRQKGVNEFVVVGQFSSMVDGRIWGFDVNPSTLAEAKDSWLKHGQEAVNSIQIDRSLMNGLLQSAEQASSGRIFYFNSRVYLSVMIRTVMFLPILLLIDWLASVSRRRRPFRARSLA